MKVEKDVKTTTCDRCGKKLRQRYLIKHQITWCSKYQVTPMEFDLCAECMEEFMKFMKTKARPIGEEYND